MKVTGKQTNSKNCLICGIENAFGVKAPFYNLEDGSAASIFEFLFEHQSYPQRTHGGMISCMLDEIMGRALWVEEPTTYGVTTSMNITFRKPVPYGEKLKARGYITFNSARAFTARGEIFDMNNTLLAEAEAKYLKISPLKIADGLNVEEEMCYDIEDGVREIDFPPKKQVLPR